MWVPLVKDRGSDQESGAEQCTIDRKGIASLADAPPKCVAVCEDFLEKTVDEDPVGDTKIDREASDPVACSVQADDSVVSAGNLILSENVMEKNSDIPMTLNDSFKHESDHGNVTDEPSVSCGADNSLTRVKNSSCLEASVDPPVLLMERCNESIFSGNPDELLEAIAYPVNTCNKDGEIGDIKMARTEQMSYLELEGGRTQEKSSVEFNKEQNADQSCWTEVEDVSQNLQESCSKNNSCSENVLCTEIVKLTDGHGEVKLDSSMEGMKENDGSEMGEIKDISSQLGINSNREAAELDSSNEQRHGAVGPEVKNGDALPTRVFDSSLLKIASSDEDKSVADGAFEKEVTADLPQTDFLDKSFSATLVNDTDADLLASTSHKSLGMSSDHKSKAESCDIQVALHDSLPECAQPSIHSSTISSNSDASIVLDKINPISAAVQDTVMLKVVEDSSTNNMVHNMPEKKETESTLQPPLSVNVTHFAETSCSLLKNAEAQTFDKQVSDPVAMDGLSGEEIIHVDSVASLPAADVYSAFPTNETNNQQSHSEEAQLIDVGLEPDQRKSSIPASDSIQEDKKDDTCMMVSKANPNFQLITSKNSVDDSDRSSPISESAEANQANVTSVNAEQLSPEGRAENLSSHGPDLVSPTVTSCFEISKDRREQQKKNEDLSNRAGSVGDDRCCISADTTRSVCSAEPVDNNSKEGTTLEDNRNPSFEVSTAICSDKTHNVSRPPTVKPQKLSQTATKNTQEIHFESEVEVHGTFTKTIHEDGTVASSSYSGKTAKPDGKITEETPPLSQTTEDGKQCSTSPSAVLTMGSDNHSEMRQYPASLFHQPFTDLQQVQLRAQIFVYGSLIQGTPPDEACMLSAFGETDVRRGYWEGMLRVAVERFQNQKSPSSGCETPVHSRSGVRVSEQVTRSKSLPSKSHNPPVTKFAPSVSSLSFPTPLWSSSARDSLQASMPRGTHLDFNQAVSPLHSYQSPQMGHYSSNGASWFPPNYPATVVIPSQCSRLDANPQYSAVPVTATVQVTPTRESSVSRASVQPGAASALLLSPGPSVTVATTVPIEVNRKAPTIVNNKNPSPAQRSRKRKKTTVSEKVEPVFPASQTLAEPAAATPVAKTVTFSAVQPSSSSPTKISSIGPVITSCIISPTHNQIVASGNTEQSAIFPEEASSRIEQTKQQAEEAAALASSAVRHSQGIWSQLVLQKNSGLASECEEKLASAAVAAAAAAAVAKAAAAAAKVASDAALQAKMMADEALDLVKTANTSKNSDADYHVGKKMTMLTPVSILKGKDKFHGSSSVISAAREASRRRLEAASAAAKRAENLDAILRAAELAAEAVAQAGVIVAMGDPLPVALNELAEAGPENYFKVLSSASGRPGKTSQIAGDQLAVDFSGSQDKSAKNASDWSNHNEIQKVPAGDTKSSHDKLPSAAEQNHTGSIMGNASSSDPIIICERDHLTSISMENGISKDTLVEVMPNDDRFRGAWFSAHVLELKDGKAHVCYNDLQDEGSGQRKEWIPLEVDGHKAPRLRIAHPMTITKPEGTKKRRRDAVGKYEWSVGDHVEAWRFDGWWEGIITEKSKEDETNLTVHFPAGGDTLTFKAWNLRPSLIWKDGQWTQWVRLRDVSCQPYEGDTPFEKRPKLSRFEASLNSEVDGRGNEETRPLTLSAKESTFTAGKNVRGEKSSNPRQMTRTGLRKEGAGVVFGVPKPASRLLRSTSKTDPQGKRAFNSRPKWSRPVKSQTIQSRSMAEKENSSVSNASASSGGESGQDLSLHPVASLDNEHDQLIKKNTLEMGSSFRAVGPTSSSSLEFSFQSVPGVATSKKFSGAEEDRGAKGKLLSVAEKSFRSEKGFEHPGKAMPETVEPRRSNRRIQPTSRLLEGLQSSLIISKIPSVSHDKGPRPLHRGGSSSRGNTHG
ncbi:Agenet domain plant type domain-containing protein [Dioscorea alata]|uniref:Agenet domain plant type domain-containing protein n=3 Tax=Dioscorea alata TaxID=55571 RepID=A0ACB7UGP1_DIOAL|nr:Agenet domain plant type domain-containing protein [Dioscorea alata]KAH7659413.1 Agenet domain plant type domain-containing protein [Dioscorea alata]KAH7659414.1 Agenet domain plant type domain-containing protein [Dioscorea alata]